MVQRTLFDTDTKSPTAGKGRNRPKCTRTPDKIIRALVGYGIPEHVARGLPVRVAFARYYALKEKAFAQSPEGKRLAKLATAAELRELVKNEDEDVALLQDTITAALSSLEGRDLKRVASGLAALLESQAA